MPRSVDRSAWVELGLRLLDDGVLPPELTIDDAAAKLGVTKGSFYTHFNSAAEWHGAIIRRYLEDRQQSRSGRRAGLVEDPAAKLWMLRADAAVVTPRDLSMDRWAFEADPRPAPGAAEAAAALREHDETVIADLAAALSDWNMSGTEAGVMSRLLAPVFGCRQAGPPLAPGDTDGFKALLDVLGRAASRPLTAGTVDLGDGLVMYMVAPGADTSDPETRRRMAAGARQFLESEGLLPEQNSHQTAPAAS